MLVFRFIAPRLILQSNAIVISKRSTTVDVDPPTSKHQQIADKLGYVIEGGLLAGLVRPDSMCGVQLG